ncbi:MAG: signal peptidase I [Oscillospiraceae bacterium]
MNKRQRMGLPELLLLITAATLLLVLLAVTFVPALLGLRSFVVTSDSMSPAISRGDLVYVRSADFSAIHPGAVVTFTRGDAVVTHRVYSVDPATRTLRTKADSSTRLDETPVAAEQVLGVVVYKLPKLGFLSLSLEGKEGTHS